MTTRGPFDLHRIPLALAVALVGFNLPPASSQSFSITTAPVTTSPSGSGTIKFTVSGIPFDGQLVISCQYAGAASQQERARLPICGAGPAIAFNVTTGETVNSSISLVPWGTPMPLSQHGRALPTYRVLASGLLLAGALLLGFGLRSRRAQYLLLLVPGALAVAFGVLACGSNSGPNAGTYLYTMTATLNSTSPEILTSETSTTATVTIP